MSTMTALNDLRVAPEPTIPWTPGATSKQPADAMSHAGVRANQEASYLQMIAQFERERMKALRVELFWIATTAIGFVAGLAGMFLR